MNKLDQLRDSEIMNEALDCLVNLLDKQLNSMGPLPADKMSIARQGLTAVYVGLSNSLHSKERSQFEESFKHNREAAQELSEMRVKLEN